MRIALSPQVRDDHLAITKQGDVLTINGAAYDFGPLPEGGVLPADATGCKFILGEVKRTDGQVHLTLLLPIAHDAPLEACFPQPIVVTKGGAIKLPGAAK